MNKYEAFAELVKDEEKSKGIFSDSLEETRENLKKIGLDFTEDELLEFAATVKVADDGAELSENDLADVNGGVVFTSLVAAGWCCVAVYGATSAWLIKNRR